MWGGLGEAERGRRKGGRERSGGGRKGGRERKEGAIGGRKGEKEGYGERGKRQRKTDDRRERLRWRKITKELSEQMIGNESVGEAKAQETIPREPITENRLSDVINSNK